MFATERNYCVLKGGKGSLKTMALQQFHKEIKNTSECIVELYKYTGIFKNTREVHREALGSAKCFLHFSSVLKNSQVLI